MKNLLTGPTRCLLVQTRFSGYSFWNFSEVYELIGAKYLAPPLGLMTVAALLPAHWRLRLVDENVRPLTASDFDWADIVLTSGMLPQQKGILTVIQRAHDAGKPVVVGGPDATSQPHIYEQADYLVLNEGEVTIPPFLEDLGKNATGGVYRSTLRSDMTETVVPRFDLIRFADYLQVGVQFSRGCPFICEFCDIIELFGRKPRTKTPDQMVAELQSLYDLGYRGFVDFVDDNFIGNKLRVMEVLRAIADWSKCHDNPFFFGTEASINLAKQDKLLRLMRENDFRYVFVGIESPDEDVLKQTQKPQNKGVLVPEAVKILNSYGMIVNGGFILGFDSESEHTARNMVGLIQDAGICMAMVGMLTALPNTQLSRRLKQEGRLFGGGQVLIETAEDIDQTVTGLNFATTRSRMAILQDQAEVLQQIFDPKKYYERILITATQLRPAYKHRLSFAEAMKMIKALLKISAKAGFRRDTGLLYWSTLFRVLIKNPKAAEVVVSMAAMYIHFSKQSEFAAGILKGKIAHIKSCGEERYNQLMTIGPDIGKRVGRSI